MIQVAVSMDHGHKLPTPKDIHGKYLDEFVNEAKIMSNDYNQYGNHGVFTSMSWLNRAD